jgi:hypothetical protein
MRCGKSSKVQTVRKTRRLRALDKSAMRPRKPLAEMKENE